ncbi:MAG TPA: hypothetical protein VMB21_14150 [Candidatus Limnocylindria bacterium]|jgi:hypothetical protein|nr:hypothetical protein [Candidatus Limnocylindria bacterium]
MNSTPADMLSDGEKVSVPEQLKALRRIKFVHGQVKQLIALDCELTEKGFHTLVQEGLIEVSLAADGPPTAATCYIEKITAKGYSLLARGETDDEVFLKNALSAPKGSLWMRVYKGTRSGLWDLVKVALGAAVGWYLKKCFG